ncbi:MAG TPA: DUF937 domain-containing protein [Edaphocola sp.]|nr:DUF937 domain-containing protein [Edaphocola sp.]
MNLSELLGGNVGNDIIGNIAQKFGLDQSQAASAVQAAIPMIMGGLGKNAQNEDGASSLFNALGSHSPNVLDNIQGFFGGDSDAAQKDGAGILGHIFGNQVEDVQNGVAKSSGLSLAKVGPIIAMLAPLVMSYLSKQKQSNNVTQSGGLGDLLGSLTGGTQASSGGLGGGLIGMVTGFLDKNKDGSPLDDILGMFKK